MSADIAPQGITIFTRIRVAIRLVAGLRGHDFHAAWSFMELTWPYNAVPVRLVKFAGWTLRQMFGVIPEALTTVSFADPPSKVSLWLSAENPLRNHPWSADPEAGLPSEVDVAVIGAGFTGAACGYHWSKQVCGTMAILEMNEAASGASGRNEGLVVMGRFYAFARRTVLHDLDRTRKDLSRDERAKLASQFAAAYVRSAYKNADMIENTIEEEGFDCDYARAGWVQGKASHDQEALDESVRLGQEAGFDDWVKISPQQVLETTGMTAEYPAGLSRRAASWHPARWVWSLFTTALQSERVLLFTHTKVTSVLEQGEHYELVTSRGKLRARHVINATESYSALLHPQLRGRLHAVQTQAAFAEGGPQSVKTNVGISTPTSWFGRHGDGVLFGSDGTRIGYKGAGRIKPSHFITKFMLGEMHSSFGRSKMHVTREWSCTAGFTDDEFPIVGLLDGRRQYIIAGMCGSGSAVHFNGARHVVQQILGLDGPDDYPAEYFAPSRVLDPKRHPWPRIED